jgi:hypothetical protein
MKDSKIRLSDTEFRMVQDAELILTKNRILQKAHLLMQDVQEQMQETVQNSGAGLFMVPPKISKGENYLGLPYVVLDYPRIANSSDLCFVRSFFWWGHFFSSTLQLSGSFQTQNSFRLVQAYDALVERQYYIGIQADPWQHHFESDNYQLIQDLQRPAFEQHLHTHPHIKIAARWPLQEWNTAAIRLWESWRFLTALVS